MNDHLRVVSLSLGAVAFGLSVVAVRAARTPDIANLGMALGAAGVVLMAAGLV